MKRIVLVFLVFCLPVLAYAQNGKFRSRISGNWNVASTWERDANGDDVYEESPSSLTPSFLDSEILIRNGHTVRVYANVTVDQVTVEATGRIVIDASSVMTVANGTGSDLINYGRVSTTGNTQLVVQANAEYVHAKNGGELPLATWDDNSNILLNAITTAPPTNLNQGGAGFYNVIWNCTAQSTTVGLAGNLRQVRGSLTVSGTNGNLLTFATSSAPTPISIGVDFIISGNSRVSFSSTASVVVNVGGSFSFNATAVAGSPFTTATGATTINVAGDFIMNAPAGILDLSSGTGSTSLNLSGDFTLTNGTILESSSGSGFITYNSGSTQQYVSTGTLQNNITHTIDAGTTLALSGENAITGVSLVVNGEIRLGSVNTTGALVTGTTLGNVRTLNRTYNSGARIIYAGVAPQFIGIGHPTASNIITEIDNSSGVSFNGTTSGNSGSTNLTIGGDLILSQGSLTISGVSTTRNLILSGTVIANGNNIAVAGSNVNMTINGSGAFGTFPNVAGQAIRTVTINRSGGTVLFGQPLTVSQTTTISNGTLQLGGTTSLNGLVSLGSSGVLDFSNQSLTVSNDITTSGGVLSATSGSTLTLTGGTVLSSPLTFSPSGNTLGSFVVNKTNGGTSLTVSNPLTVANNFTITDGIVNVIGGALNLTNGATLSISSLGSITGTSPSGGPWNLVYTQGSKMTGLEIPSSGTVQSVSINTTNGSTVTLTQHLTVNNSFTIINSGRSFSCGNFNVIITGNLTNSGSFGAPFSTTTPGLTVGGNFVNHGTFNSNNGQFNLAGNFTNNGTFNHGTGTLIFNGTSSIGGSVSPTFGNITIQSSSSLSAPASLTLVGTLSNNGTFNAGSGTVVFSGTTQQSIGGNTNTQFNNISITNVTQPVSVILGSDQSMGGQLSLASSSVFDPDGSGNNVVFTLLSSSTKDAGIGVITSAGQIIGQVTVQRYLKAKDNDYRFLSSPVSNTPVSQLQDDFSVTGTFTGTSHPCTGCDNNGPSLRYYSEAVKGVFSNGYAATPATNGTNAETLVVGKGYSSYMWNGGSDIIMDVTGSINWGTVPFTVSHTVSSPIEPAADGWNLIGNPYPSAIAWNNDGGWSRSANIDPVVWVWDVLAATWRSYNANTASGNLTNGVLASGQGFWVYVTPGAATLSVSESAKVSTSGNYLRSKGSVDPWLEISLSDGIGMDNAYVFKDMDNIESPKLELGIERLSVSVQNQEGRNLAYYSPRLEETNEVWIPLSVSTGFAGEYTLSFIGKYADSGLPYYLYDAALDKATPLSSSYSFRVEDNGHTKQSERFFITTNSEVTKKGKTRTIEFYPNPVNKELSVIVDPSIQIIQLLDGRGTPVYLHKPQTARPEVLAIDMRYYLNGIYYLRVVDSDGRVTSHKVLKQ